MVELKGSQQEINWAEDIRLDMLSFLEKVNTTVTEIPYCEEKIWETEEEFYEAKKQLNLLIEFGGNISNASFFIIKRDLLIHALVEKSGHTKALKLVKCYFAFFTSIDITQLDLSFFGFSEYHCG